VVEVTERKKRIFHITLEIWWTWNTELKEAERVLKSILKVGSMSLKSKLMSWTLQKKSEKYGVWKFTKQNAAGSSDGDSSHHIILRS